MMRIITIDTTRTLNALSSFLEPYDSVSRRLDSTSLISYSPNCAGLSGSRDSRNIPVTRFDSSLAMQEGMKGFEFEPRRLEQQRHFFRKEVTHSMGFVEFFLRRPFAVDRQFVFHFTKVSLGI